MTDMNKEVPNPVYNYMNSDKEGKLEDAQYIPHPGGHANGKSETYKVVNELFGSGKLRMRSEEEMKELGTIDFEEIRKRKRARFKEIATEIIDDHNVSISYDESVNDLVEKLAVALLDSSEFN